MDRSSAVLDPELRDFYTRTLAILNRSGVPYLLGGAYALAQHAGIERHTKDLDIVVRRDDRDRVLGALGAAGYRVEVAFPHWLAKAHGTCGFVDVIYNSGNGLSPVDDAWFDHATAGEVFGIPVRVCPAEELLWVKAFIQERERFDGADVAHLIRRRGESLDWDRLLDRFGDRWPVLLGHLIFFAYIYPAERARVPTHILDELQHRWAAARQSPILGESICHGTTLSREQYLIDIGPWGDRDARVQPLGPMTPEEVAHWTAAISRPE